VFFALASGEQECRLGITATRRLGGAVLRNRARRRMRELFRRHGEAVEGLAADLVVNLRRSCVDASWTELERDYLRCLRVVRSRLHSRE
jgi:ribonuclease P protein component